MANTKTATLVKETLANEDGDLAALRADLAALKSDFTALFETVGDAAKKKASQSVVAGKDAASTAAEQAGQTKTYVETKVRENPLAAVGIAAGLGFLVAALRK